MARGRLYGIEPVLSEEELPEDPIVSDSNYFTNSPSQDVREPPR
jgi:hypothetical protein